MAGDETKELPPELAHILRAQVPEYDRRSGEDPDSDFSRIEKIRSGISLKEATELVRSLDIDPELFARSLRLSPGVGGMLGPADSEKVLRVSDLFGAAVNVFHDWIAAREWFLEPARGLAGRTPLEMLDTGYGASMVADLLGAIEQGNYW